LAFYDITNEKHAFAIHMLFKFVSINRFRLEWKHGVASLVNEKVDSINLTANSNGEDELNFKLEQDGKLIREI
jgi:hypothetical protein